MNHKENKYYREPLHPHYLHRAAHHDYSKPACYLVTVSKSDGIALLSFIDGTLESPAVIPTSTGIVVEQVIPDWLETYQEIRLVSYVIMPDHVHLCIKVLENLKPGLSRVVASFMGRTTKAWFNAQGNECGGMIPFFKRGFNDRIAYDHDQWDVMLKYVSDNPRRLLMKRKFPDIFFRRWVITLDSGLELMACGNIFLLQNGDINPVRFSRRYGPGEFDAYKEQWIRSIDNGGVIVSPFIHPKECEVRNIALERGGNIIRICANGFSERFMPQGREFDYMGTRHLLLIAPMEHKSQKQDMTYSYAQYLNQIATAIASLKQAGGRIRPVK